MPNAAPNNERRREQAAARQACAWMNECRWPRPAEQHEAAMDFMAMEAAFGSEG